MEIRICICKGCRYRFVLSPVQLFKCLSDETRLDITLLIHCEGELCVCELMTALGESQPKISRHLAPLRSSGILQDERRGQWVYYAMAQDLPVWAARILDQACEAHGPRLSHLQKKLQAMKNRPMCC